MKSITKILSLLILVSFFNKTQHINAQTYHIDTRESLPFNSTKNEHAPAFYKNGLAYVASSGKSLYKRSQSNKRELQYDIYYVLKNINGDWTTPKEFNKKVNSAFDESSIFFYNGGYNFVMTRNNIDPEMRRKLLEKKKKRKKEIREKNRRKKNTPSKQGQSTSIANKKKLDEEIRKAKNDIKNAKTLGKLSIFSGRASKSEGQVTQLTGLEINSLDYSIAHPNITPDGKHMVVTSNKPGGKGGYDLYKYTRIKGRWASMSLLPSDINSSADDVYPFILDNYTLFFSSNRVGGKGGLDVYKVDGWQTKKPTVTALPTPINSPKDDFSLILSPDRKTGYFSSNREGGKGMDDIYYFTKRTKILKVNLVNENNDKMPGETLTLKTESDEIINSYVTDKSGRVTIEVEPKKNYVIAYFSPALQLSSFLFWGKDDMSNDKNLRIKVAKDIIVATDPLTAALNQKSHMVTQISENRNLQNVNKGSANVENNENLFVTDIEEDELQPINNEIFTETRKGEKTTSIPKEETITAGKKEQSISVPQKKQKKITPNMKKKQLKAKFTLPDNNVLLSASQTVTDKSSASLKNINSDYFKEIVYFSGKLTNANNIPSPNAKIIIEDIDGKILDKVATDKNGFYRTKLNRFAKYWITVENGSEFMSPILVDTGENDKLDFLVNAKTKKLTPNTKVPLNNLRYVINISQLNDNGNKGLLTLARFLSLKANLNLKIEINSYTDSTGPNWLNNKLSAERANKAKEKLVQFGVNNNRIKAYGRGETNLINQCVNGVPCSRAQHAINRRTEITIK